MEMEFKKFQMSFVGVCVFGVLAIVIIYIIKLFLKSPQLPSIKTNQYWGPGEYCSDNEQIVPFKIKFTNEMIADLKSRLNHARFTDSYEDVGFEYGFHSRTLNELIQFWIKEYKFTERETYLNKFPQYKTNIQGLDIHFIHVRPLLKNGNVKILPIVLLHGWPGSIREFYEMIPLLLEDKNDNIAFEVIVPSLPGFGFSQGSSKVGLGPVQIAVVIVNLMRRLGFDKFYVQGGDWGSIIGSHMATLFPNNVLGYHTNMAVINTPISIMKQLLGSLIPSLYLEKKFHHRVFPIKDKIMTLIEETGYLHEQATKPDTIGAALEDSPSGLAAWIVEKFSPISGKNKIDGGISKKYSYTDLIDNLMFYWVGKSATTSARIYAEAFSKAQRDLNMDSIPTHVPVAVARFPDELAFSTRWQLQEKYLNILQISDLPQGGHFAAFEVPKILADDVRSAVLKFENFYSRNN